MKTLAVLLLAVLAGCNHPPQLATSVDFQKQSDDSILIRLKVASLENRATVPINVELTGQAEKDGHWDKPGTLLHPAAFVLNSKEERVITKEWKVRADAVRATLVVKEQERGNLLKTEKTEKVLSGAAPRTTSQP